MAPSQPATAQRVQQVPAELLLQFGGIGDDPAQDLFNVRRVLRTGDGRFIIVTSQPVTVRVHDAGGRYLHLLGRSGEGPGEYRSAADLGVTAGDTVQVVSSGTGRWSVFRLSGDLVREYLVDAAHPIPGGVTLQHGAYARHQLAGSRGCPHPGVLARHAPTQPFQFVETLTDGRGRTWRHDLTAAGLWHVYTPDGVHRFDVRLPPRLVIHQFAGDQLIGVTVDDDDANRVVVYRVRLAAMAGAPPAPCVHPRPARDGLFRTLSIHARNAFVAGEAWRSDFDRYPATVPEMEYILKVTEEAEMKILHTSSASWVFAVSHLETGAVCLASFGPDGLPGWESGSIACSATGGTRRAR
jgi:hypothetical protein